MNLRLFVLLITIPAFISCAVPVKQDNVWQEVPYPETLQIQSRSDWGWKGSVKPSESADIRNITILQSGINIANESEPSIHYRNMPAPACHFLINADGTVYEAQPIGTSPKTTGSFDPTGHILICVMGDYETEYLNQFQMRSLIDLSTYLVETYHIPLYNIQTMKEYSSATLPAKHLYQYIENDTLQARIRERLPK